MAAAPSRVPEPSTERSQLCGDSAAPFLAPRLDAVAGAALASGDVVSAQDAAAIVEALLEGHALDVLPDENAPPPPGALAANGDASAREARQRRAYDRKCFLKGFWQAYDACLPDDGALLAQGIRAATLLQRSVVQQAVSMVEKKEITTLRHFRYAYITSATSDVFAKPLAVRKLALFLLGRIS